MNETLKARFNHMMQSWCQSVTQAMREIPSVSVCVLLASIMLMSIQVTAATNDSYVDIGAKQAPNAELGAIVVKNFSLLDTEFAYTGAKVVTGANFDYLPKVGPSLTLHYEGINGTTYKSTTDAPLLPGKYRAYLKKPNDDWVLVPLSLDDPAPFEINFEIKKGVLLATVDTEANIDAYSFAGRAVLAHDVTFDGKPVLGAWSMPDSNRSLPCSAISYTRTLTFTPDESSIYAATAVDIIFNVNKIALQGLSPTAGSVTYGTNLNDIPLNVSAPITAGLDEIVTVSGQFTFDEQIVPNVTDNGPYAWTFTPDANWTDSFVNVSGTAAISVTQKYLLDVALSQDTTRLYKDYIDGRGNLVLEFGSSTCSSTIEYATIEGTPIASADILAYPAGSYNVVARATDAKENYTFSTIVDSYLIAPRPVAYFEVDTKRTYSIDDLRTAVVGLRAYGVEIEGQLLGDSVITILDPDNSHTDSWYELRISYTPNAFDNVSKNYAQTDTSIWVFREKAPVSIANVRVSPLTYPASLGMSDLTADPIDGVTFDINFTEPNTILDFNQSGTICNWQADPTDASALIYADSVGTIPVIIQQCTVLPYLASGDTMQTYGQVRVPYLNFNFPRLANKNDTAPYMIEFFKIENLVANNISQDEFLRADAGTYTVTYTYLTESSSNYRFDKFSKEIIIKQAPVQVSVTVKSIYVGDAFGKGIDSYRAFGPNVVGTNVPVAGTLRLIQEDEIATKVEQKSCSYEFTPVSRNYAVKKGSVFINVKAGVIPVTTVACDALTFGQKLKNANLRFTSPVEGTIAWSLPEHTPVCTDSGKTYEYVITPKDNINFFESRGSLRIEVNPYNLEGKNHVVIKDPIDPIYNGRAKQPVIEFVGLDTFIANPVAKSITYDPGCVEVGAVTTTIEYAGNYKGRIQGIFTIYPDYNKVAIVDTQKIFNGNAQSIKITGLDSLISTDIVYTDINDSSKIYDARGVALAGNYRVDVSFTQGSARWSKTDSFIIARKQVESSNIVYGKMEKEYDGKPLDIAFNYANIVPIPADTEYAMSYTDSAGMYVSSIVDTGLYYVSINHHTNFVGIVDSIVVVHGVKPQPPEPPFPPEPPQPPVPPTPPVPEEPPAPPPVVKDGSIGFNMTSINANVSSDVNVGVISTAGQTASVILSVQQDPQFECSLYVDSEKLKPVNGYYSLTLNANSSKWLSIRTYSSVAFAGKKTVKVLINSIASLSNVSVGYRAFTISYTSDLVEFIETPVYSVSYEGVSLPDSQYFDIYTLIREDQRALASMYVPTYTTSAGAMVYVGKKTESSVGPMLVYDYSTMSIEMKNKVFKQGITDSFYCEFYNGKSLTRTLVTVITGKGYIAGTTLEILADELNLRVFAKTPSSKGYYIEPYKPVKLGKSPKPRKVAMKMSKCNYDLSSTLTITGNVVLENKKKMKEARKYDFLKDIVDKDTAMVYQQKSVGVEVSTKAKTLDGKNVEDVVRSITVVPPSFTDKDTFYIVRYINSSNFKETEYFYFTVQNAGSKPSAFGEYIENGKIKRRAFAFIKKDMDVIAPDGSIIRIEKNTSAGLDGRFLLKKDKLMTQDLERLDLVINNKSGSYGRTIKKK